MRIIRYLTDFTEKVAASRTAQIFFFIHLAILMTALIQKLATQQTIQPIHFEYDFLLYKILTIINLPVTIVASILLFPFILLFSPTNTEVKPDNPYPLVIFAYIAWQIQWAVIGYGIEKLFRRKREKLS